MTPLLQYSSTRSKLHKNQSPKLPKICKKKLKKITFIKRKDKTRWKESLQSICMLNISLQQTQRILVRSPPQLLVMHHLHLFPPFPSKFFLYTILSCFNQQENSFSPPIKKKFTGNRKEVFFRGTLQVKRGTKLALFSELKHSLQDNKKLRKYNI